MFDFFDHSLWHLEARVTTASRRDASSVRPGPQEPQRGSINLKFIMAASIRLELFAQAVHDDLSHVAFKETKARVCTQAFIDLSEPGDVENVFINAARAGSLLSILSPCLRECQHTFWSDGDLSWQEFGRRFESVQTVFVMVAIDQKERLPQSQLSTDCLGGVVIMISVGTVQKSRWPVRVHLPVGWRCRFAMHGCASRLCERVSIRSGRIEMRVVNSAADALGQYMTR
jgi:hypothetical protein